MNRFLHRVYLRIRTFPCPPDKRCELTVSGSTSLQFTSESGTSTSDSRPQERNLRDLDKVLESSPAVRFLSRSERQRDKEELQRAEEHERDEGEVEDLEPLPVRDGVSIMRENSREPVDTTSRTSEEPLLRDRSSVLRRFSD